MAFEIHPRLAVGGHEIGRLGGCRLLLKDNALFPWFLLIPEVAEIEDLHELPLEEFQEVMAAMRRVSEFVVDHFRPEKLNVACIGNQTAKLQNCSALDLFQNLLTGTAAQAQAALFSNSS